MGELKKLFKNNREWSAQVTREQGDFFKKLANQQSPDYLWIGCSDSRVPANELVGLLPGEVFVHRNVANMVIHTDFNGLSVIQYAVEVLNIKDIIVCGHYDCGGVKEALANSSRGLVNNWLRHLRDIQFTHGDFLDGISDPVARNDRLCELNIIEQVRNVCRTTTAEVAWQAGKPLTVHGWIYNIGNGLLQDLDVSVSSADSIRSVTETALRKVYARTERIHDA
ncbi:carbonate dehydratase [Desulfoluna spongiiphila]|uniref:Carbonic anhydrase n=1 Tax=Desulfoluna spongiiphila TaxID=419481 RepID=A0A1G5C6U6_9BACT|nr:carbonate dehydratase [Desulfoluna spongiiphila]SCX98004.1 carbonic anhydrase [Desulfoluna spongiiphila]VVS94146.1 carbonic anhydrase [Desulfoluna spongiiphila]